VAGNNDDGGNYSGDGYPATNANVALNYPQGVALAASGNLFIADTDNSRIREVLFAGSSTLTLFNVTTNDTGIYTVTIADPYGSVTSVPARLLVPIPPAISITNPADYTIFVANQTNVTLTATASDVDGAITQVQFFEGATSLGTATSPPYSLVWYNAPVGSYALTAVAIDNFGCSAHKPA